MEAKFTKGEWEIFGDWGIRAKKSDRQLCENNCHATFEYSRGAEGEGFANAHLMANAPDMYNKLKEMSELLIMLDPLTHANIELDCQVYEIEQLLNKARGE